MKLPFNFSVQSAFRILLPGFFAALAVFPLVNGILNLLVPRDCIQKIPAETVLVLLTIIAGWLIGILDMHIYMVFEGRRYWPKRILEAMKKNEERRLKELNRTIARFESSDRRKYLEASVEIRRFPMNDNSEYTAEFPTRLGNLLAAYEGYPTRVYSMDSPFYWPRIWLKLDKDLRQEVDSQQAMADSAIYTSTSLYFSGFLCAIYAVVNTAGVNSITYLPDWEYLYLLAVLLITAGYGTYRGSLHIHAQFGETFKSIFDIFRHKVFFEDVIEEIAERLKNPTLHDLPKREQYKIVWRYLHNWRIKKGDRVFTPTEIATQVKNKKTN